MKYLILIPLLFSCGFKVGDCVLTNYAFLSRLGTNFAIVKEVYSTPLSDNNLYRFENTNGVSIIASDSYKHKTSCESYQAQRNK